MSKKSRSRKRKEQRDKEKAKQKQVQFIAFGIAIVIIVATVGFLLTKPAANSAPPQAAERLERDPVLGSPDAPVTIVEYGAYACPACRYFHEQGILESLIEQYPGQVNVVFRDMPVINPPYDHRAAEVAQCVFDQGNDAFWQMHDWLYTQAIPGRTSQSQMISAAANFVPDVGTLRNCVESGTHRETVRYDLQRGNTLGIRSTPTFLINGQMVMNPSAMPQMIEQAIAQAGG